jgi:hypothetical protein
MAWKIPTYRNSGLNEHGGEEVGWGLIKWGLKQKRSQPLRKNKKKFIPLLMTWTLNWFLKSQSRLGHELFKA